MTPGDIQKMLGSISKSGINVKGDLVLEKHVEHEVNNVEPGGIGIQINNGKSAKKSSEKVEDDENEIKQKELSEDDDKEELNFESPKISLQQLLKQPWFAERRSDGRYDAAWTDAFVEKLMASEHGEALAREWYNNGRLNRCTQIKGYVLGLLKEAGVLKGSHNTIAAKVGLMDNPRSFARYMANGKKRPYADWVKAYAEE